MLASKGQAALLCQEDRGGVWGPMKVPMHLLCVPVILCDVVRFGCKTQLSDNKGIEGTRASENTVVSIQKDTQAREKERGPGGASILAHRYTTDIPTAMHMFAFLSPLPNIKRQINHVGMSINRTTVVLLASTMAVSDVQSVFVLPPTGRLLPDAGL